eukprot:TRINITY_DN4555_c0_g2_i2.p1 TRINITY_DN4555_c0_g2~~TRINITY_DN4555_c0_g2_i2.p1  ORF type:complete len:102 (+),score=9.42 TRINITY_DN4555_c0_g2_i2:65-370(+)
MCIRDRCSKKGVKIDAGINNSPMLSKTVEHSLHQLQNIETICEEELHDARTIFDDISSKQKRVGQMAKILEKITIKLKKPASPQKMVSHKGSSESKLQTLS